jgi:hypothetical protein
MTTAETDEAMDDLICIVANTERPLLVARCAEFLDMWEVPCESSA